MHFSIHAVTLNSFQGLYSGKDADPEHSGQHDDRALIKHKKGPTKMQSL
jgi:hypothetical protein